MDVSVKFFVAVFVKFADIIVTGANKSGLAKERASVYNARVTVPHHPPMCDFADRPFILFWEVTRACALACQHCRATAQPQAHPEELSHEEALELVDKIAELAPPMLVLTGGDPMMRRDIFDIIERAAGKGLRVALSPAATNRLLNTDLKALLVDGYCFRLMPHSKQLMERRPIFFDFLDGPSPDGEYTGIWLDYEKAGYLGGKYLLEHGCKHPLFIPSRLPYYTRMQPENYCRHKERQFIAGFSRVLQENGMDPMCYILDPFYTQKNLEMLFYNLLADPVVKPDGVFASRDYEIITFLKIASELRIDIPSIKLVGGGNTPWSQKDSLHPYTSIEFHFDKCAKKLMEQAQLHPDQRTDIYIEPELLERD